MRIAPKIEITCEEQAQLQIWAEERQGTGRRALRAKIVLLAAQGLRNLEIAERLKVDRRVVGRWRHRFRTKGIKGIEREASRRHGLSPVRERLTRLILETTLTVTPPHGKRWTTRSLAEALNVSRCRVDRVWRAHGISHSRDRQGKINLVC